MHNVESISDDMKTIIDETEHNRWNVEKLSDGFVPTSSKQHDKIMQELNELLNKYSSWRENDIIEESELDAVTTIDKERRIFKYYKDCYIHDNIRSNEDLDAYSKAKDRFLLDTYLKLIQKKECSQ